MTKPLAAQIEACRAGLEAELAILRRLQEVAAAQGDASRAHDFDALQAAAEERERLMTALCDAEESIRGVRAQLSAARDAACRIPGYREAAALHAEVASLTAAILKTDDDSLEALANGERLRREHVRTVEQGETTLAAYRRAMTMPSGASLVDRHG